MMMTMTRMTIPLLNKSVLRAIPGYAALFFAVGAFSQDKAPPETPSTFAPPTSAAPSLRAQLVELDLLGAKKEIHARSRLFKEMLAKCRAAAIPKSTLGTDDSGTCAILFTEGGKEDPELLRFVKPLLTKASASVEQTLYYRARCFTLRPKNMRDDLIRALIDWTALERVMPESGEIAYWKGVTLRAAGEHSRSQESFEQAEALNSSLAVARKKAHADRREEMDGLSWGWSPWLSLDPNQGLSAGIHLFDDRLFDFSEKGMLDVSGSTRGSWRVAGRYEARDWFKSPPHTELGVALEGSAAQTVEDYFGLGIDSDRTARTTLRWQRGDGELRLFTAWQRNLEMHIGWALHAVRLRDRPDLDVLTTNGPVGRLSWDTRDSRSYPTQGVRLAVDGYFPSTALGARRSFERWNIDLEGWIPIARRHTFALLAIGQLGSSRSPFNEFSRVSGSLAVPGLRPNRYRDTSSVAAVSEYRFQWKENDAFSGFFSAFSLAPSMQPKAFRHGKYGGGVAWSHHEIRNQRSIVSRVELGVYHSEWVLQGGVGLAL